MNKTKLYLEYYQRSSRHHRGRGRSCRNLQLLSIFWCFSPPIPIDIVRSPSLTLLTAVRRLTQEATRLVPPMGPIIVRSLQLMIELLLLLLCKMTIYYVFLE